MNIELAKIGFENFEKVIDLELEREQEKNLPSNVYSIAESSLSPLFHPRAILAQGKVVGFVMYQFGQIGDPDEEECTIWRLMIDRAYQGTGIGTQAMALVLDEIKSHNRCKLIDIYFDAKNLPAKKLYARYGFQDVGFRDDGDVIAELKV